MTAEAVAKDRGGRKAGSGWTARYPTHDDRTPSLSVRDAEDNKVLVRCHAGCDQERVITALRTRGLLADNSLHSLALTARRTSFDSRGNAITTSLNATDLPRALSGRRLVAN